MAEAVKPKSSSKRTKSRGASKRKNLELLQEQACRDDTERLLLQRSTAAPHAETPKQATEDGNIANAINVLQNAELVLANNNVIVAEPEAAGKEQDNTVDPQEEEADVAEDKEEGEKERSVSLIEFSSSCSAPAEEEGVAEGLEALKIREEDAANENAPAVREEAAKAQPKGERVHARRLYPKLVEAQEQVKPFTERQLMSLYYNAELEANEEFVEQFVQRYRHMESHEFYELVTGYLRSRRHLTETLREVGQLQKEYEALRDRLWEMVPATAVKQGTCACGKAVEAQHRFLRASFDDKAHLALAQTLQQLRDASHETCAHHLYAVQLAHLQVDLYVFRLLSSSPALRDIPSNAPVAGFVGGLVPAPLRSQLDSLKACISILFSFQRRPIPDRKFLEDTRQWLTHMVAVLLRTATLEDHLFILNHVLRCPAGIGSWAAHFVQPPRPPTRHVSGSFIFGSPFLDHAVTVLATILTPIRGREQFLEHLKAAVLAHAPSSDQPQDNVWVYVDSDGDDDEDISCAWVQWRESDIVSLLNQVPIPDMFRHVLLIEANEDVDHYDPSRTTEQSMMKLLAFATHLLQLYREGLKTFNFLRYRQLTKRISRLVRHAVKFVSDHWLSFRNVCRAQPSEAMMARLQVEFDQFFMRAVNCIFSSQRTGAWQFMAALPFAPVSSPMMWRLLWLLHNSYQEKQEEVAAEGHFRDRLKDEHARLLFEEKLSAMAESEVYYLLSAFERMATSRGSQDADFISTVATEIFQVAFLNSRLRDTLSKDGKDHLSLLASKHPFVVSVILKQVEQHADSIGSMSLYLFRDLPLKSWVPSQEDLSTIEAWLLQHPLPHPCNQLARLILVNLDWSTNREGTDLVLASEVHRQVALMLVEACAQFGFSSEIGSLVSWSFQQLASSMLYRAATSSDALGFATWAWEVLLALRLHLLDHPAPPWASIVHSGDHDAAPLSSFLLPDMRQDPSLHALCRKVEQKQPAACYVALTLTASGHSASGILDDGLGHFSVLVNGGQYLPAIHALFCLLPPFFLQADLLLSNQRFVSDMQTLLTADLTYLAMAKSLVVNEFPGKILQQVAAMMRFQVEMCQQHLKEDGATVCLLFWLRLLLRILACGQGGWFAKRKGREHAFYLLDVAVKAALVGRTPLQPLKAELGNAIQMLLEEMAEADKDEPPKPPSTGGVVASLLSFVSGHGGQEWPSLLPGPSAASCPWFSWLVLTIETQHPRVTESWRSILQEMSENPRVNPEIAIKRVSHPLRYPSCDFLPIFRWAHHAVDVPLDHPALPLFWQHFFTFYLQRATQERSIGMRFFEAPGHFALLKRMKKRLKEAADHHHRCVVQLNKQDESEGGVALHQKLTGLLRSFSLWLEEPRIHEGCCCVRALPPQYDPPLLEEAIAGNQLPWFQFVNFGFVEHEMQDLLRLWRHLKPSLQPAPQRAHHADNKEDPASSILSNLRKYEDPLPPPNIPPLKPPVATLREEMLGNTPLLMAALENDFRVMCEQAKSFVSQVSKHVALDCVFVELLPVLYRNVRTDISVKAACRDVDECIGPATLHLEVEEGRLDERVQAEIDQNRRDQYILVSSLLEVPPQNVCSSAVRVENFVTMLVRRWREAKQAGGAARIHQLKEIGVSLFYLVMSEIDETTRLYSPTRQFLASCLDVLGQEFVQDDGEQCLQLLKTIIAEPSVVGLVTPLFNPGSAAGDTFADMYEILTEAQKPSLTSTVFVLLTKFDLSKWLRSPSTTLSHRRHLLEVIGRAICAFGLNPDVERLLIFDMYRNHLQTILMHEFPEHYSDTLHFLLQGMDSLSLNVEVWYDFLRCLGFTTRPSSGFRDQAKVLFQKYALSQFLLQEQQLEETLLVFGSHFRQQRKSSSDLRKYGLYSKYGPYLNPVAIFLGLVGHAWIFKVTLSHGGCSDAAVDAVWHGLRSSFDPWVSPMKLDDRVVQPWLPDDVHEAGEMMSVFVACLLSLHECLQGSSSLCSVLSYAWDYYLQTYAHPYVEDHVLSVCCDTFLALPWDMFLPTPADMQAMNQVMRDVPHTLSFVCSVFLRVPWVYAVDRIISSRFPDQLCSAHTHLANMLVQVAFQPSVAQARSFVELVNAVGNLSWHLLGAQPTTELLDAFLARCNPACIFEDAEETSTTTGKHVDVMLLRFLKIVSGMSPGITGPQHSEIAQKRAHYVRTCAALVVRCSAENPAWLNTRGDSFKSVVCKLLGEAENAIAAYVPLAYQFQEGVAMVSQLLALTGSSSSPKRLQTLLLEGLLQWVRDRPGSLLLLPCLHAAGHAVADVDHLTAVTEGCIAAYCALGVELLPMDGGWSQVVPLLHIPEMTRSEFLASCSREGAYLTMHAYLLQRLPVCRSLDEELALLGTVTDWCAHVKASEDSEPKFLLLWDKVLELSLRQVDFGGNIKATCRMLGNFSATLSALGEDRQSTGLLGAVGLGKRSPFSPKTRFMARALASFILVQMPSTESPRRQPSSDESSSSTSEGSVESASPRRSVLRPGQQALQCVSKLEQLRTNRQYAHLRDYVEHALEFVWEPRHGLWDARSLLQDWAISFYPEKTYLRFLTVR